MEHLFSVSAYQFDTDEYGGVSCALEKIKNAGADGIELLTGYFDPDPIFKGIAKGVHLPYATDWYSAWIGDITDHPADEKDIRYRSYGTCKKEMIETLTEAVGYASSLSPAYGVIHASTVRMDEIMCFRYRDSDEDIITALAEMLNGVSSSFPNGEPPFKIVFENLWWPGLTMTDDSGFVLLTKKLKFDNWGLCLDTGHLMNRLATCREEKEGIDNILNVVKKYPKEMIDKIDVVHLHMSLSADYINKCIAEAVNFDPDRTEVMTQAYGHICNVDQHRPFTDASCKKILDILKPNYVTHEISAPTPSERIEGFIRQRSLL
jgi:sugar phosphate isomerase/epimerase